MTLRLWRVNGGEMRVMSQAASWDLIRETGMPRRLVLGVLLSAGLAGAAWAQDASRFDGQYVGEMTLTGIVNGDCSRPPLGSSYPLTIRDGVVRFKYVPRFDTTLVGKIDTKGDFKATAALHHGTATMTGHVRAGFGTVTASIVTPSCQYSFQTK